jgi:hypothetical protein
MDDDGIFGSAEMVGNTSLPTNNTLASVSLVIPPAATLGQHRLRMRCTHNIATPSNMNPCTNLNIGEAEDYMVNIVSTLAIKLADIKAENQGKSNLVSWNTTSEEKGDFFVLERSADGKEFEAISTIKAEGYAHAYTHSDATAKTGISYYRLALHEQNGRYGYSKVVTAIRKENLEFSVSIYPNPVDKVATMAIYSEKDREIFYEVTDVTGKTSISLKSYHLKKGANRIPLNTASLASGSYAIRIFGGAHNEIVRFTK